MAIYDRYLENAAKREVRFYLASNMLQEKRSKALTTIMIMAGRAPEHEIKMLRELCPNDNGGCFITAVDRDPVACDAAARAGADRVIMGELADIAPILPNQDFIFLDACGNICRSAIATLRTYASIAKFGITFTALRAREHGQDFKDIVSAGDKLLSSAGRRPAWANELAEISNNHNTDVGRVEILHSALKRSRLRNMASVALYLSANRSPMMSVAFVRAGSRNWKDKAIFIEGDENESPAATIANLNAPATVEDFRVKKQKRGLSLKRELSLEEVLLYTRSEMANLLGKKSHWIQQMTTKLNLRPVGTCDGRSWRGQRMGRVAFLYSHAQFEHLRLAIEEEKARKARIESRRLQQNLG